MFFKMLSENSGTSLNPEKLVSCWKKEVLYKKRQQQRLFY